ncbi:MAG: hypothetical protein FWD53_11430, partial [Phycisphaerales bacterium]|nr:hypothetical protein [Phycisphaerales bacterium]
MPSGTILGGTSGLFGYNCGMVVDSRWRRVWVWGMLLVLALTVRGFRAWQEEGGGVINPDAIRFIVQGQRMVDAPLGAMREESYHPLHAAVSLAVRQVLRFEDDRQAWLAAVRVAGVIAGAVVTLQIVALARLLGAPFWCGVAAAVVWAFGRRTSYFGADGLSDMLFLALFGEAMIAGLQALRFRRWWAALFLLAGWLMGLGYLARPEALFAGVPLGVGILQKSVATPLRGVVASVLLCVGAAICVVPYAMVTGSLSH